MEDKKIVEINGVKLEIDMRFARVVDNYRVGDNVKVLVKGYSDYKSHPGVIIGFDNFAALPTILISYLESTYGACELKTLCLNAQSKDVEICKANENDLPIERERVLELLDRDILKKEEEVRLAKDKKSYFVKTFGQYFNKVEAEAV